MNNEGKLMMYINSILEVDEQILHFFPIKDKTISYTFFKIFTILSFLITILALELSETIIIDQSITIVVTLIIAIIAGLIVSKVISAMTAVFYVITNKKIAKIINLFGIYKTKAHRLENITGLFNGTDNENKPFIAYNMKNKDFGNISNVSCDYAAVYNAIYDLVKKIQEQDMIQNPEKYQIIRIIDTGDEKQELLDFLKECILLKDEDFYNASSEIIIPAADIKDVEDLFKAYNAKIEIVNTNNV